MGAGASFFSTLKASICLVEELIQLMEEIWFLPLVEGETREVVSNRNHFSGFPLNKRDAILLLESYPTMEELLEKGRHMRDAIILLES